jgi:hypothetical protein
VATFTDTDGRQWRVALTAGDLRPLREHCRVEVGKLLPNKMAGLGELLADPERLIDAVRVLVRGQHPEVTDEQFGRSLGGDALEDLADAFVRALADFSPRQSRRPLLAILQKAAELETTAADRLTAAVEGLDPAALLTSSVSAGSSPASSASTPAPSPFAS